MAEEKRGRGRPKSTEPTKDRKVTFRLDEAEYQKLKEFSSERGLTLVEDLLSKKLLMRRPDLVVDPYAFDFPDLPE